MSKKLRYSGLTCDREKNICKLFWEDKKRVIKAKADVKVGQLRKILRTAGEDDNPIYILSFMFRDTEIEVE